MTEAIKGKTLEELRALFHEFHEVVTGKAQADEDRLGKLAAFAGVSAYPMRVKCATLAWHTLMAALDGKGEAATTES
jgi:nitrogen fixation NifU-like protein